MLYALSVFELTYKLLFYFDNYLYKHFSSSGQSIDLNNMNLNKFAEENISPNSSILYSQNVFEVLRVLLLYNPRT